MLDIDIESIVLGGMLIEAQGFPRFTDAIGEVNVFGDQRHAVIYEAMSSLFKESGQIDVCLVSQELRKRNRLKEIGGSAYLVSLTERVSSAAHIEEYARILLQNHIKRNIKALSQHLETQASSDQSDPFALLDYCQSELDKATDYLQQRHSRTTAEYLTELLNPQQNKGVPMAIEGLHCWLNGYHPGELTVIAGRPGMGKTAFALNDALHQARSGYPVGFISLEMTGKMVTGRAFANYAGINSNHLCTQGLSREEMEIAVQYRASFGEFPLYIEEASCLSLLQIRMKAKEWIRTKKIKILYVDYLQLIIGSHDRKSFRTRDQEVGEISRFLKGLAKELNIPVVALAQLSREVEKRGNKLPTLSDLRESGSIEQDADNVMLLYRPDYYQELSGEEETLKEQTEKKIDIILAKYRNGSTGRTTADCDLAYMRFR